jgi:uncharacterized protein (TIGR02217 family)
MAFFETEFPRGIGYKRLGSPSGFNTTVNTAFSGQESRNKNWSLSRGEWTVSLLTPPPSQFSGTFQTYVDLLNAFFLAVSGRGDAFRLFDHVDNAFTGVTLGVGDGSNKVFQLQKTYSIGGRTYVRIVTKPIQSTVSDYQGNALPNTIKIYDNGTLKTLTTDYGVDRTTGIVTFVTAPAATHVVTADGQFHFPVRFDSDQLPVQVEDSDVRGGNPIISINSMKLVEVRPPNY